MAKVTGLLKRDRGRFFKALVFGDLKLSVQGSEFHYSTPRETVDAEFYTHLEVALMDEKDFVDATKHERCKKFSWAPLFGENTVSGWVPLETIDQIIKDLESISPEPGTEGRYVDLD